MIDFHGGPTCAPYGLFDEYQDIQLILQHRKKTLKEYTHDYHVQQTHQQVKDKEVDEFEAWKEAHLFQLRERFDTIKSNENIKTKSVKKVKQQQQEQQEKLETEKQLEVEDEIEKKQHEEPKIEEFEDLNLEHTPVEELILEQEKLLKPWKFQWRL